MAYSVNQTTLSYRTNTSGAFTLIPNLMEVPDFGGTPEKIDVTTLGDRGRRFIRGTKDFGDLVFRFLYDNADGGNYRILRKLSEQTKAVTFQLTYPDGTAHEFKAQPSVRMDAGTVNGALTFSATMLLQSDIEMTGEGGEVREPVTLPPGVLTSRVLSPEEYTVEPGGVFQTKTVASEAFNNMDSDNASHDRFRLDNFHYGKSFWQNRDLLTQNHSVVTAEIGQHTYDWNTWHRIYLAIPQKAEEIGRIEFHTMSNQWEHTSVFAETIHVEPYTVEGFETHRVFGEFIVNKGEEDESRVAYSIIVGARPNREGDGASILYTQKDCCNITDVWSGVRFELLEGPGNIVIQSMGMQTLAPAENTFVESRRHLILFKKPLEEGDRLSIMGTITTTKRRIEEEWECCEQIFTIPQPLIFDFLRPGHPRQDISPVTLKSTFPHMPEDNWEEALDGIRIATLSSTGLEIRTGFWHEREHHYRELVGSNLETTWDINIEEIEIISRT